MLIVPRYQTLSLETTSVFILFPVAAFWEILLILANKKESFFRTVPAFKLKKGHFRKNIFKKYHSQYLSSASPIALGIKNCCGYASLKPESEPSPSINISI